MPLKLIPPRKDKSPNWSIRGTYLGRYVDRSAGSGKRAVAAQVLKQIERDIERGSFADRKEQTFAGAALAYMNAGGERKFVKKLLHHFGDKALSRIDQAEIDAAALKLYPDATAATRNRQVYTPTVAILRSAGVRLEIKRPAGAQGNQRVHWLWPEQAEQLFDEAKKIDAEFGALLVVLCYTGVRLSEALHRDAVWRLAESFAYIPDSKTGKPVSVFLPPVCVAVLANLPDWEGFRFAKSAHLYKMLYAAAERAGVDLPERTAFHIFRHTYATWMRRYGGLDAHGLLATDRWKNAQSVRRYDHIDTTEAARKATLLPVRGKAVG